MRHLNGTKFGSPPNQFRGKTAMVAVSSTFAFASETTVEELKNYSKTKTLRSEKHWFLALCLEESVRRYSCR